MIKRFRDWMHGRGRNIVIMIIIIGALLIIVDYYSESHKADVRATTAPAVIAPKETVAP